MPANFLTDDFNDNSFDTSLWDSASSPGVSETSGKLHLTAFTSGTNSTVKGKRYFNLKKGVVAAKMTKSGTTHSQVYIGVGVIDAAGNNMLLLGQSSSATFTRSSTGITTGATTIVDTTVGLGPTWTGGTWLGSTYNTSDNTYRLLKSTDGVTWTQILRIIVTGGAMNWADAAVYFQVQNLTSPASNSNVIVDYDDYTFFGTNSLFYSKVRVGGAWVTALPKMRVGGAWVPARSKVRLSGVWGEPN